MSNNNSSMSLTKQAENRWEEIYAGIAPEFSDAIEVAHKRLHVTCPVHGTSNRNGKGNGFRMTKDWTRSGGVVCNTCGIKTNGFQALAWLRGWDIKEAAREVGKFIASGEVKPIEQRRPQKVFVPDDEWARKKIEALRALARPATGTPVEKYLRNRGLTIPIPSALRFIPKMPFWHTEEKTESLHPGMAADITTADDMVRSVHRTYLTDEGTKADLDEVKKVMIPVGTISGGAIKLYEPIEGAWMSLAEGIETALAVYAAVGLPIWSTVSAGMLATWDPAMLKGLRVKGVLIWADLDVGQEKLGGLGAGESAAFQLQQRLLELGIPCYVLIPDEIIPAGAKGVDWLDVYRKKGVKPFKQQLRVVERVYDAVC